MIATPTDSWLEQWLERWTDAALLSPDQARAIHDYEVAQASPRSPEPEGTGRADAAVAAIATESGAVRWWSTPSMAEALGYLGGVLALVGLVSLVATYWTGMPIAGRLGFLAAGSVGFAIAGLVVDETRGPALARLRWLLWWLSTATTALFAGFFMAEALDVEQGPLVALVVAAAVGLQSVLLWAGCYRPLQALGFLVAVPVVVGTAVVQFAEVWVAGIAVWITGAVLLAFGLHRSHLFALLHVVVGAATVAIGAALTVNDTTGIGLIFVVLTAGALVALAIVPRLAPEPAAQVIVGVVGLIAAFQALPQTIAHFAPDAGLITGAVIWLCGAALIGVGAAGVVRVPRLIEAAGGAAMVGGAAVIGVEAVPIAVGVGLLTALGLLGLGVRPDRLVLSLAGSLGLLVNVPWAISHFFPGEGRAPVIIMVIGVLIVGIAVALAHRLSGPQPPGSPATM